MVWITPQWEPPIDQCPQCKKSVAPNEPFCECGFDLVFGRFGRDRTHGECLYCGTKCEFSVEHIFGKWLHRKYRRRIEGANKILIGPRPDGELSVVSKPSPVFAYAKSTLNMCEDCNNALGVNHDAAAPVVQILADGGPFILAEEERIDLARWVVMCSINLLSDEGKLTASSGQLRNLRNGAIPPGFIVAVAQSATDDWAGKDIVVRGQQLFGSPEDHIDLGPVGRTTFCIERAAFLVYTMDNPGMLAHFAESRRREISEAGFQEIFPEPSYGPHKPSTWEDVRRYHGAP